MRRFHRPVVARLFLLLLGAAAAVAQGTMAAEPLDPEGAVRIALENHPLLAAADDEVAAAEADRDTVGTGYLPRIDLVEDFAYSNNPVFVFASKLSQQAFTAADFDLDTLNDPDAYTNFATRIELRQNIWDGGGTDRNKNAARFGVEAAQATRRRTEDEIAFGAIKAFWDLVLAEEMVRVTQDAEKAAESNFALASELVDAGLAVPSDRMSAEVRLGNVRAMRIRAGHSVEVAQAALRFALGLDGDRAFRPVRPDVRVDSAGDSLDARLQHARQSRDDLNAMRQRVEQTRIGEKTAKGRRLPQFGLGAAYEMDGDRIFGADGTNWAVGVNMRIPLFEGNETKGLTARARADRQRMEHYLRALEHGIELQVRSAWADRDSAAEVLDVSRAALVQAEEALRIVRERYGEGMAVMVELLAAEAAQTEARANVASSERSVALAEAGLALASGERPYPIVAKERES